MSTNKIKEYYRVKADIDLDAIHENVVNAKAVNDDNEVMLITTEGIIIQLKVSEISTLGRITSGVKLIDLDPEKDIVVASMAKVRDAIPEENGNSEEKLLEELQKEMDEEEK